LYCKFHFERVKNTMKQYCVDGVCEQEARALTQTFVDAEGMGRVESWTSNAHNHHCKTQEYYCAKLCSCFLGNEFLFQKCSRSCDRNFDLLQNTWGRFCKGGACKYT